MRGAAGDAATSKYSYDKLNRLDTWYDSVTAKYTQYIYDNVGNITEVKDSPDNSTWTTLKTFGYDNAGKLNNSGYAFDDAGNQTEDPTNKYVYDSENRLTSVVKKSDIVFEDDFSDGNYTGWNPASGTWAVESGQLSSDTGGAGTEPPRV